MRAKRGSEGDKRGEELMLSKKKIKKRKRGEKGLGQPLLGPSSRPLFEGAEILTSSHPPRRGGWDEVRISATEKRGREEVVFKNVYI